MPSCFGVLPNPFRTLQHFHPPPLPKALHGSHEKYHSTDVSEKLFIDEKRASLVDDCQSSSRDVPDDDAGVVNAPDETEQAMVDDLILLIEGSVGLGGDRSPNDVPPAVVELFRIPWIHDMVPGLEKLAAAYHVGNFVMVRERRQLVFEFMPLYARIGMHLLFYGTQQRKLLKTDWLQNLLKKQSVKQGIIYDSPSSRFAIPSFVKTWSIETDELLDPELDHYGCFNEFFYRRLKPGARPIDLPQDGICSVADCRLTVYENMSLAREFWVKGRNFTIPSLLNVSEDSPVARDFEDGSVAIFRLAPSDYHRFHSPIYCTVGNIHHVDGEYFTVNPQAVTQKGLDILTANIRSVLYLRDAYRGCPIAFVAVGALLVGSIKWTTGAKTGASVKRGDELGYFAYGGSTVVAVFPKDFVEYDDDLVENSKIPMETLVKVGWSIGKLGE